MRPTNKKPLIPIFFIAFAMLLPFQIQTVMAYNKANISLPNFDNALADQLGVSEGTAGILLTLTLAFFILVPANMFRRTRGVVTNLVFGILILSFCTAVGWLPIFAILLIILLVAGLWANTSRKTLGG